MNIILLPQNTLSTAIIDDKTSVMHLKQVLKVTLGDTVKVGIKNGHLGTAVVSNIHDSSIELSQIHCTTPPPAKLPLTVILAIPRPKVLRRLFLDMTAMGAQHIILVNSYRSEKSYWQTPFLTQLDTYIQEGLQQACDTVSPTVSLKKRLKPFVEDELPTLIAGKQAILAHPYAHEPFTQVWDNAMAHVLVIGAEGGWIDYEVELFKTAGCQVAHIGNRILRTENAVSVLCGHALLTRQ